MKTFWGSFFGTLVGIFITTFIVILIITAIVFSSISGIFSGKEIPIYVKPKSVLHIKFDGEIKERSPKNPFKNFLYGDFKHQPIGLNEILANIEKAKNDDNIKGIYLDITAIPAGIATVEEIRNALLDFKTSKKFILAYSEVYTQGAYYLASAADKIYLNPEGIVEFKGLSRQVMFFKKLLEKLEIDVQIFRHGKYKSAIEPFDMEKMSPANREQTLSYMHSIWNHLLTGISKQRGITIEEMNKIADNILIRNADDALKYKLVDKLVYKDEMLEILRKQVGVENINKVNYIGLNKYSNTPPTLHTPQTANQIAIIYAVGTIENGEGDDETIGSERISKAIRKARLDSNIKAIVLRVNSPGGSALSSDIIWREMTLAKKMKPVIVSMGDVAASGGYYISCAADAIVAHPNTITGSIGVFGLLPNAQRLFSNKFGITVDTANTNKHSDFYNAYRAVNKEESTVIQKWIEDVYDDFIGKVGESRKMSKAEVDSIGQGRVWSGEDGKQIGLVDEFGGIKDAIALAAKKANIKEYKIVELPEQKDLLEEIFENITGEESSVEKKLQKEFGSAYNNLKHLKLILKYQGVQARLPYDIVIY
ncbi:MAG: signal peptide peptidase SppA [Bacteroidota bacterium]